LLSKQVFATVRSCSPVHAEPAFACGGVHCALTLANAFLPILHGAFHASMHAAHRPGALKKAWIFFTRRPAMHWRGDFLTSRFTGATGAGGDGFLLACNMLSVCFH
jgi:hypothetical protein